MAVEIVVLVPALVLVMLLVVALGRYVSAEGAAQAAAREGARAASFARDEASARTAAQTSAAASVPSTLECDPAELTGVFEAGETVTVRVRCDVSWANLGLIGLEGSASVSASSSTPLDTYRRTGGTP